MVTDERRGAQRGDGRTAFTCQQDHQTPWWAGGAIEIAIGYSFVCYGYRTEDQSPALRLTRLQLFNRLFQNFCAAA